MREFVTLHKRHIRQKWDFFDNFGQDAAMAQELRPVESRKILLNKELLLMTILLF